MTASSKQATTLFRRISATGRGRGIWREVGRNQRRESVYCPRYLCRLLISFCDTPVLRIPRSCELPLNHCRCQAVDLDSPSKHHLSCQRGIFVHPTEYAKEHVQVFGGTSIPTRYQWELKLNPTVIPDAPQYRNPIKSHLQVTPSHGHRSIALPGIAGSPGAKNWHYPCRAWSCTMGKAYHVMQDPIYFGAAR